MKFIEYNNENVLFIELVECINCGISEDTIKKATLRKSQSWLIIKDPTDRRKTLVGYEKLSPKNKELIQAKYGDPYGYVVKAPILGMLKVNVEASRFFLEYRYGGSSLPTKTVKKYTRAAQWLTLINAAGDKSLKIIKSLGIKTPVFFQFVGELMQIEKKNGMVDSYDGNAQLPGDFPTTYQNLQRKAALYKEQGYAMLIDKMYGNKQAAKVNDEVAEAQLLELIENPMQYDDVLVAAMYNVWASKNNYKMIEPPTVGVWRRKRESEITIGRYGNSAFNEKYIRQVKGLRPSAPLFLVEHDDNNLDFLFSDGNGNDFNRYVAVTVSDCKYHPN
ncbi:hypothetical protein ESA94_19385 [Lacibacter luteus]|uniref:Uncharacterized protein n=1 Tax=Lacibacter luteus TaxID=2508719 RepID=A0A4Q1CE43_9BACT|nr:hypothetical protein [Lacibacter luteus]RXK57691.1 hypothetical protein ESA94_19385 [Lacibacter luteus]